MKIFLILSMLMLAFSTSAYAQTLSTEVGFNSRQYRFYPPNKHTDGYLSSTYGYNVALALDIPFYKFISLGTGVGFTGNGTKLNNRVTFVEDEALKILSKWEVFINYMDFPIVLNGYYEVGQVKFNVFAGQKILVGLFGKEQIEHGDNQGVIHFEAKDKNIKWGTKKGEYTRYHYGLIFGLSLEYKNLIFKSSYFHGLNQTEYLANLKTDMTINSFDFTIGYVIKRY